MRITLILSIVAVFASGCKEKEEVKPVEQYSGEGRVVEANPEPGRVLISHSDIPGFMEAMIMSFRLHKQDLVTGVENDDSIHFTLTRTDSGIVVTKIEVLK